MLLEIPTHEEVNYIDQSLMAYNHSREPFLQTNPFIPVNRCLKNENGEVIAGVLATLGMLACVVCRCVVGGLIQGIVVKGMGVSC